MQVFSLHEEQEWNPQQHIEKVLGRIAEGDVTVACWEPGQVSPYHCHPEATEIYSEIAVRIDPRLLRLQADAAHDLAVLVQRLEKFAAKLAARADAA